MTTNREIIEIDGSKYEGGGQILRSSVALSIIMNRAIRVYNIRAGRPRPGLGGTLSSCKLGSSDLELISGNIRGGSYEADVVTAGSISLVLQAVTPILAFAKEDSELKLFGGTDTNFAPPIDYVTTVIKHYFEKMGLIYKIDVQHRGFYPEGGGFVKAKISALQGPLSAITLVDCGNLLRITGYAMISGKISINVATGIKKCAKDCFLKLLPLCPVEIDIIQEKNVRSRGNITTFMFVAHTSNGCRLAVSEIFSPRDSNFNELVTGACQKLYENINIGACFDENMQDQIIILMALAQGNSKIRCGSLTMHTKTVIYITELFLPVKFEIKESNCGSTIISCNGIGYFPDN